MYLQFDSYQFIGLDDGVGVFQNNEAINTCVVKQICDFWLLQSQRYSRSTTSTWVYRLGLRMALESKNKFNCLWLRRIVKFKSLS